MKPEFPAILLLSVGGILKCFYAERCQDIAGTGSQVSAAFGAEVGDIWREIVEAAGKYIGRTGGQVTDAQGYSLDFWKLLFNLGFRKGLRTAKQSENIQVKIGGLIHTITLSVIDKVIVAHREGSGNAVGKSGQENYGNY